MIQTQLIKLAILLYSNDSSLSNYQHITLVLNYYSESRIPDSIPYLSLFCRDRSNSNAENAEPL